MKDDSLILAKLFLRFVKEYDLLPQISNGCVRLSHCTKYSKCSYIEICQYLLTTFGHETVFDFMLNYTTHSCVYCALWYYKILHNHKIYGNCKKYKLELNRILKYKSEKIFLEVIGEDTYLNLLYAADL